MASISERITKSKKLLRIEWEENLTQENGNCTDVFNFQMGDCEKMGEEERDQKIIEFFRAVFKTYDADKAGRPSPKSKLMLI